jgi:hypothetical protein
MFGKLALFAGITLLSTITAGSMVASAGPTAIQSVLKQQALTPPSYIERSGVGVGSGGTSVPSGGTGARGSIVVACADMTAKVQVHIELRRG